MALAKEKRYKMKIWIGLQISERKPRKGKGNWGKLILIFGIRFLYLLILVAEIYGEQAVTGWNHILRYSNKKLLLKLSLP